MIIHKINQISDKGILGGKLSAFKIIYEWSGTVDQPPPWYKINTDGGVFLQQQATGVGMVIHDHEGKVVVALSKKLHYSLWPLGVEVKAMEEVVEFA